MASLKELYSYYCRRCDCRPNSAFCTYLDEEDKRNGGQRILRTVDVSGNYLGKNGIIPVLDLVKNIKTVERLDVGNNRLEHEQLDHLVYCLMLHPTISAVGLRDNCLHDGSTDHLVRLLEGNASITEVDLSGNSFLPASLALIDDCLRRNRAAKGRRAVEDQQLAEHRAQLAGKRASFTAAVSGSLVAESSGGHFHYASWWTNPQYRLCVSRQSRVSIVMKVAQQEATQGTRPAGFAVLHFDGMRRVIEISGKTIVAESPVDASGHCCVEVELLATGQYVVVPFTFHPSRGMEYALSATMMLDETAAALAEGWVTLDALDAQYDWFTETTQASWTAGAEGGGCAALPSWRHNPMFRLRYNGKQQSSFWSAPASVQVLLYKSVDADDNDSKQIGLDIVEHDPGAHGRPPLVCSADLVRCSHPHRRRTAIMARFTCPASSLDLFVVPSTKLPRQAGTYTLAVFSTVPFELERSGFPHGWNHRVVEGEWNEDHCGGCKDLYASWKNNLSYRLLLQDPAAQPGAPEGEGERSRSIVACLELAGGPPANGSQALSRVTGESTAASEFKARHAEARLEMCVAAVSDAPPSYAVRRSSAFSDREAQLLLPDTSGAFLLVPMARHAGQTGPFRLHLFSATPFIVTDVETVVERERAWQLTAYARENEARRSEHADALRASAAADGGSSSEESRRLPALREVADQRERALQQCEATGVKFMDRDFPSGSSSLWLDPEAKPPAEFAKEYTWERLAELDTAAVRLASEEAGEEGGAQLKAPPYPHGRRAWFASLVNALAAKPHWLARVVGDYDRAGGFAQFCFFKGDRWVSVTVDDCLPVDAAGHLCMGHATSPTDWVYPLAEKAYAKLHRCYEALEPAVTPELSLLQILAQGLEDVSGAECRAHPLHPQTAAPLTPDEEEEDRSRLWRKVKEGTRTSALHCLVLRGDCAGAAERRHAGLLPDHLYAIADARFVEHQRLVKLRNWRDGVETVWRGKWVAESPLWTDGLRAALEYAATEPATAAAPQEEFWLSFDEVLYYFSDLLVTELPASRCFLAGTTGDVGRRTYADDTNVRLRAQQYALAVSDAVEGCASVEVTVGLHRADARMTVTRAKEAIAKYRHALGMAVLATHDNYRHVKEVEESQLWCLQTPARARDIVFTVRLDPTLLASQLLTIMPFREHNRDAGTPFIISASSDQATVSIAKVDDNTAVRATGEWRGLTAGGPPSCPTWRDNQQFFLYPSRAMEVTISVARTDAAAGGGGDEAGRGTVGFTVHTTRCCRSFLHFHPGTVVAHVAGGRLPAHSAQLTVVLAGMQERRGMPYVVVPYYSEPGAGGGYELTVIGNQPMRLAEVEPRLDWHRLRAAVSMRADDGTAGGSPRYPSWRCGPQLAMEFPVALTGRVLVTATNRNTSDDRNTIGMMLLRGSNDPHYGGMRRRLLYDTDDVIAESEETVGRVSLEVDVGAAADGGGGGHGGATAPLILVIFTSEPYKEVDVDLAFYAEAELLVSPVREWKYTAMAEGCWELGQTAGGNRREYASWINNPFHGLTTVRPTSVLALLIQYPRATDYPIVKRLGKQKAFLPPPITNPDRRMTIELDLVVYDEELTALGGTGPTRDAETALAARLEASEDQRPYILVPAPTVMAQNADYKLFVYADQPIDLFVMDKERLS